MERLSTTDPVATRLFTVQRTAISSKKRHRSRDTQPPSLFSLLCGIAVISAGLISLPLTATTAETRGLWNRVENIINTDIPKFFHNVPFRNESITNHHNNNNNNNNDDVIMIMSALPMAIIAGMCITILVGVCVYYDSSYPGLVPMSPCCTPTPKRQSSFRELSSSQLSLGYKMTLGNGIVLSLLCLITFRIYFNLPFLQIN